MNTTDINPVETVQTLRGNGYKVIVDHWRNHKNYITGELSLMPQYEIDDCTCIYCKGGHTHVKVLSPEGKEGYGIAMCNVKDNYNRKLGVALALSRALNSLK